MPQCGRLAAVTGTEYAGVLLRTAGAYPLKPAMDEVTVPNRALIVVGDGEKALFLRNKGSPQELRLEVEHILGHENPATHEQGTDKPGRSFASAGTARSAMEETDWHRLGEERFAAEIATTLYRLAHANKFEALVVKRQEVIS